MFHVDYSTYSESPIFTSLIGTSDLYAVTEGAIVFLQLFAVLFCSVASYGFYHLNARFFSPVNVAAKMDKMEVIERIEYAVYICFAFIFASLPSAILALRLTYQLGWRYRHSSFLRFIVRLPGIRSIPYVYWKYWLPSETSPRPRPRFFYLKRLFIRQGRLSHHFP